ncbi:unnamed protein product [Somion occarium]|uniref:Uncharacterized protein n=1 Tax=Somion occarium TaxID=3059160 RepID=A0ABP1DTW4_9APHY
MGRPNFFKPPPHIQTMTTTSQSSSVPDLITYRLNDKLVYVTPAATYEQAIAYAKEVFTDELDGVDPQYISFSVQVAFKQEKRPVGIGPMAWKSLIARLQQYEVVDIMVHPQVVVHSPDDTPPEYPYADDNKEQQEYLSQRSSPSSPSRALPRSRSRTPPCSASRESSPGLRTRALSWIERHMSPECVDT